MKIRGPASARGEVPMRAISYCRVSTREQAEEGYSLVAQNRKIESYADLYEIEIVDVFADVGTGGNMKRPGLQDALAYLQNGKADAILIAKLDRLTRSVKDLCAMIEAYFGPFDLLSVEDRIDTSTASGRLILNILVSVFQWEREVIGERTRAALRVKKENGERVGHVPYGFRESDGGMLVADEDETVTLALMKDLRSWKTLTQTAEWLSRAGVRNRDGNPFSRSSIDRLTRREEP